MPSKTKANPTASGVQCIVSNGKRDKIARARQATAKTHFTMENKTPNSYLSHSWGCNKPHILLCVLVLLFCQVCDDDIENTRAHNYTQTPAKPIGSGEYR